MNKLKEERKGFETIGNSYPVADNITRSNLNIAGIPCAWFSPADAPEDDIVFFIHGGGFIYGSINSHAPMVSHIALKLNRKVLMIDYRLAPENPFPAGIDDCVSVINAIQDENLGVKFSIIGDSAGGNITMATQLRLKALNRPPAKYTIVISPWVDLRCINPSYTRNQKTDTVLSQAYLQQCAEMYAPGKDLTTPLLSPVNGDFQGIGPVLILCGTAEILEDDSIHLQNRLLECNVQAELKLFKGELHVWPFMDISSKASQEALNDMADFATKSGLVKI
ncbi:alpha/beta hydrolase [Chitinophaga sp. S165]|uniref:alpha/beta hydrolase n=1 Tax=Chitinophaga sp. S165 TaxID=2135462 RepID=UPI000D712F4D|nr:alpha/beta hydrolase [Chitinophaga sp. S165]PWV48772.1 acetyl esterase/lipase [Chitinophaga sp. S165]